MRDEILPYVTKLDTSSQRIVVAAIGIGTAERAREFCRELPGQFPVENLYADPENVCYDSLKLKKGVVRTFFSVATPFAMRRRIEEDGAALLRDILPRWKPWLPPRQRQALNQGGVFVLRGRTACLAHYDQATGDHIAMRELMDAIRDATQAPSS